MSLYSYKEFRPLVGTGVYISANASVIGRVFLNESSNIWFGCTLRGDVNDIRVGENTNIQDHSMLHVTESDSLVIGKNTSVGHGVTLHGCSVGDGCLIGMGAIILDRASIGDGSIVAAGSVVSPGKVFPPGVMIMGSPARVTRELSDVEKKFISNHYKSYLKYASDFNGSDVVKID